MGNICIKIDLDTKWNMRKKAQLERWDMSHLVRRLMEMWLAGDVRAGKPRPIRQRLQTQTLAFRISDDVRLAFNVRSRETGWTSAALIRKLLDLWYIRDIDVGVQDDTRIIVENGEVLKVFTLYEASKMLGVCQLTVRKRIQRDGIQGRPINITEREIETIRQQLKPRS